ncbi:MAG TPA: arylsulfatase [Pirellulaceae bacterium]|nr:arylsulfatase [Pirellulaceae bacterium]
MPRTNHVLLIANPLVPMMYSARFFLCAAALLVGAVSAALAAEPASHPNIIFILADDLGYGDLGCYGQQRIKTPHIDGLAREGMRFTDFYAGCTVCAPSRCVLMTGYHMGHCHVRGNAGQQNRDAQILRDQDVTIAELLKRAGYATALCGKWGLGEENSIGEPTKQGFDYFFGYLNQHHAHNYYPAYLFQNEKRYPLKNVVPGGGDFGSGVATRKVEYSADLIAAEALKWVEEHKDRPFFLYFAATIPHANNEAGKEGMEVPDLGQYADKDWPPQQKAHAAMISRLDADVGRLMALLKKLGLDDNTLVFFSSDNGPHREGGNDPDFNDSNGPLKGIKRDLTEGGIRVPFIARWPGHIKAGTTSDFVGSFQDMLPTLAELAGASADVPNDIDGLSIVPTLLGQPEKQQQHDYLYWAFYERGGAQAARAGRWKAVQQPLHTPVRLYDLSADIGEEHDLAAKQPETVAKLAGFMREAYRPSENWRFPDPPPAGKAGTAKKATK